MSMSQARKRCMVYNDDELNIQKHQFDIVSVRDERENEVITKILAKYWHEGNRNPYTLPWIGLQKHPDKPWSNPTWSDESLILYTNWGPKAPTDFKVCS